MAFFKFRKGGDDLPTPSPAPESVEALRKRARHRLMGAALLVLLGVIGFPLLFDSQPRPIAVDIPIEIPDKNTVKPLGNLPVAVPAAQAGGPVESEVVVGAAAPAALEPKPLSTPAATAPADAKPEVKQPAKTPEKTPDKPVPKPPEKPVDKAAPVVTPVAAPAGKADDGSKAQALLDGQDAAAKPVAATARFVVQVGAFSDAVKAREARMKLEKAGMKTYTQVVEPKEGRRTRVRVGPFESRAEADKAAEKIRKLDLSAAILEL
jgi:DedD protein